MVHVDPWLSRDSLRWFLCKLKESGELDVLIKDYVSYVLCHRIIMSPSRGPYGEKGKDIVAIENEVSGDYCSYIIKRGTLQENLDGPFGILRQMRDAMTIDLEIEKYQGKRRTVVVVHNGDEGYRGAINRFEKERVKIESEIGGHLLLRPISRWDIEEITDRFFKHRRYFKDSEIRRVILQRMSAAERMVINFKEDIKNILANPEIEPVECVNFVKKAYEVIKNVERKYGPFKPIEKP